MNAITIENLQTLLIVALVLHAYGPKLRRLAHRVRARRAHRRLVVRDTHARCVEVRDQADVAAHVVSDEARRRLWLIRSGPSDVA